MHNHTGGGLKMEIGQGTSATRKRKAANGWFVGRDVAEDRQSTVLVKAFVPSACKMSHTLR